MSANGLEPVEIVDPWLYQTFSADPTITSLVADRIASEGTFGPTGTPFITWTMNGSRNITDSRGRGLWNESLYAIKVVGQGGSFNPIKPIAKRISELIDMVDNAPAPGGGFVTVRHDRTIRYPEVDDNVSYRHLGAIWRITAHA